MYKIIPLTKEYAKEIMKWKYVGQLSIYNLDESEETLNEILSFEYYAVIDANENLIGFFCVKDAAIVPYGKEFHVYDETDYIDIGLGMNPNRVGQGNGYDFFKLGLDYFKVKFQTNKFRLTVFDFNERAIHIYQKLGFKTKSFFKSKIGHYFYVMTLDEA